MYDNKIRTGIVSGIHVGIDFGSMHDNKKDLINENVCTVTIAILDLIYLHEENKLVYKTSVDTKLCYLKYGVYDVYKTKKQLIKALEKGL